MEKKPQQMALIKELRERTGAGLLDCKKALEHSDYDIDGAIEYLQVRGIAKAAAKAGRIAAEGLIQTYISDDAKEGFIYELNCETDFVARNEKFQKLADTITQLIASSQAQNAEEALQLVHESGKTLDELIKGEVATIGENIQLRRLARVQQPDGFVAPYNHMGSQLAVLITLKGPISDSNQEFAREVAMHIAGMKPTFVDPNSIPEEDVVKQTEIFTAQVKEEGKPENIIPNIVKGKLKKWKEENALLAQPFVKNPDITVKQLQEENGEVQILDFYRFQVGEGIEKSASNLAEEVAAQLKDL